MLKQFKAKLERWFGEYLIHFDAYDANDDEPSDLVVVIKCEELQLVIQGTGYDLADGGLTSTLGEMDLDRFSVEMIGAVLQAAWWGYRWACTERASRGVLIDLNQAQRNWRDMSLPEFKTEVDWVSEWQAEFDNVSPAISMTSAFIHSVLNGRNPESGYIYCLADGNGNYKIGRTKYLSNRIRTLSAQPPFPVKLIWAFRVPDAVRYEAKLHRQYAQYRVRPNCEWFRMPEHTAYLASFECHPFFNIQGDNIDIDHEPYIQQYYEARAADKEMVH